MQFDSCPACYGRRLSFTWEERKVTLGASTFVGSARVLLCKTCRHKIRDPKDYDAFVAAAEQVANGTSPEGGRPYKIERQRSVTSGIWAFAPPAAMARAR